MTFSAHQESNRFAWLTPIHKSKISKGPWILCENYSDSLVDNGTTSTSGKVTTRGLLSLVAGVSGILTASEKSITYNHWQSACGRFIVIWHKRLNETSRLFVQNRDDHYARIELHIDDKLVLAFQEPVWPHLQQQSPTEPDRLNIPEKCLFALEASLASTNTNCSNDSTMIFDAEGARVA